MLAGASATGLDKVGAVADKVDDVVLAGGRILAISENTGEPLNWDCCKSAFRKQA